MSIFPYPVPTHVPPLAIALEPLREGKGPESVRQPGIVVSTVRLGIDLAQVPLPEIFDYRQASRDVVDGVHGDAHRVLEEILCGPDTCRILLSSEDEEEEDSRWAYAMGDVMFFETSWLDHVRAWLLCVARVAYAEGQISTKEWTGIMRGPEPSHLRGEVYDEESGPQPYPVSYGSVREGEDLLRCDRAVLAVREAMLDTIHDSAFLAWWERNNPGAAWRTLLDPMSRKV